MARTKLACKRITPSHWRPAEEKPPRPKRAPKGGDHTTQQKSTPVPTPEEAELPYRESTPPPQPGQQAGREEEEDDALLRKWIWEDGWVEVITIKAKK